MDAINKLLQQLHGVKNIRNGTKWLAQCPAHDDQNPSLYISIGRNGRAVLKCFHGCSNDEILAKVGLTWRDIYDGDTMYTPQVPNEPERSRADRLPNNVEAIYDYTDANGSLLYQVVRFPGKSFPIRSLDTDGHWYWEQPRQKTLYRLPEILHAVDQEKPVLLVEGEKDVHTVERMGFTATTSGGARSWHPDYAEYLRGAKVVVIPDADEAGREWTETVCASLQGVAEWVKVVELPVPDKGDITDWVESQLGCRITDAADDDLQGLGLDLASMVKSTPSIVDITPSIVINVKKTILGVNSSTTIIDSTPEDVPTVGFRGEALRAWFCDSKHVEQMLPALGIPASALDGVAFQDVLPGREDFEARLTHGKDGHIGYVITLEDGKTACLSLTHVYMAQRYKSLGPISREIRETQTEAVRLSKQTGKSEFVVWALRLLYEAGLVTPVEIPAPELPDGTSKALRRTWEGFLLLLGLRWLHTPEEPAPFSFHFAETWIGATRKTISKHVAQLMAMGYLDRVDEVKPKGIGSPIGVFLPGSGVKPDRRGRQPHSFADSCITR